MGCGSSAVHRCGVDTPSRTSSINERREQKRVRQPKGFKPRDVVSAVDTRREVEVPEVRAFNAAGGEAIYSDEIERRLGGGTGYKLVKEVPSCHGNYYEAYEIDPETGEYLIAQIAARREQGQGPTLKPRG